MELKAATFTLKSKKFNNTAEIGIQVPQVTTLEDGVQFCGGEAQFLGIFNSFLAQRAPGGLRSAAATLEKTAANWNEFYDQVVDKSALPSEYVPREQGVSMKAVKENVDKLRSMSAEEKSNLSKDDLLALLGI